jgi:phage terminase large subunit-like protein
MNLLEAMQDKNLFRPWFRDPATWAAWRAFVAALFALKMTPEQLTIFRDCTNRTEAPTKPATEAWLICGRRAGKSFILALTSVYLACFFEYRKHLSPGERGTVLVIATNAKQARVIFRYVRALLTNIPMLKRMIEGERTDSFDLTNGTTIEIHAASFRGTRGYTCLAALCDEIAFWPQEESSRPDYEVLNALRPGMATIPNSMLLCASTPYSRRGALWDAWRRHFSINGDPVLV